LTQHKADEFSKHIGRQLGIDPMEPCLTPPAGEFTEKPDFAGTTEDHFWIDRHSIAILLQSQKEAG
jgi:hypothetical protein